MYTNMITHRATTIAMLPSHANTNLRSLVLAGAENAINR